MEIKQIGVTFDADAFIVALIAELQVNATAFKRGYKRDSSLGFNEIKLDIEDEINLWNHFRFRNVITDAYGAGVIAVILQCPTWMDVEMPDGCYKYVMVNRIMVGGVVTYAPQQRIVTLWEDGSHRAQDNEVTIELMALLFEKDAIPSRPLHASELDGVVTTYGIGAASAEGAMRAGWSGDD